MLTNENGYLQYRRKEPHPFEQYLSEKGTDLVTVSVKAEVRLFILYRIILNKPVSKSQMLRIQKAIYELTGDIYRGSILIEIGNIREYNLDEPIGKNPAFADMNVIAIRKR
jgi:hypothetical protein